MTVSGHSSGYRLAWLRWRNNRQTSAEQEIVSHQENLVQSIFNSTISALLAFVFIWRILVGKFDQDSDNSLTMSEHHSTKRTAAEMEEDVKQLEHEGDSSTSSSRSPSPKRSHRSGVAHLLQTDVIPTRPTERPPPVPTENEPIYELRTVGVEREGGNPSQDYLFVSSDVPHLAYNFLDSIVEEDSDDLRSQNSRPTSTDQRGQAVFRVQTSSSTNSSGVGITEVDTPPSGEARQVVETLEEQKPSEANLSRSESQRSTISSSASEKASVIDNSEIVAKAQLVQASKTLTEPLPSETSRMMDFNADRDQTEMLVVTADQFSRFTPLEEDGRASNTSVSINLDRSRDSLLDHSVCSNPYDEISVLQKMTEDVPKASVESDDEDLPEPPQQVESRNTLTTTPATITQQTTSLLQSPAGDSAAETISNEPASETVSPISNPMSAANEPKRPSGPERLAEIVYGYGEENPLNWSKTKLKSNAFGDSDKQTENKENRIGQAPQLTSAYVNTSYTSSFQPTAFQHSRRYDYPPGSFGMNDPPLEPPPAPPFESRSFTDDDLMNFNRSRSTVREIPIQRELNPFGVSQSSVTGVMSGLPHQGGTTTAWTTTRYDPVTGNPQQEEYYRREVMTRTLVTRSTEALSAPPPLSRSSPVDMGLRQLPEPRDEITEEILYKYSKNIEEEERRIRASQEERERDEAERRRRIEEKLRQFEEQERERLERLRREREQVEKDFENELARREAIEQDRIKRDRDLRNEDELRRRAEWQRLEDERRKLEEAELAKRRQMKELEKERLRREKERLEELERQRLEAERRRLEELEKQRLETERIERERIERERIEIERIERIKREQREKEEKEAQRRREAEEKLLQERLEAERLQRERDELERRQRELVLQAQREAEERARQRHADQLREQQLREQERRDREMLEAAKREAEQRERLRRQKEAEEQARLEQLRREQERLEHDRLAALERERLRHQKEQEEAELRDAALRNQRRREQERLEEQERERRRRQEEAEERQKLAELEAAARDRHNQRLYDQQKERQRMELEQRTKELAEIDAMQAQRREQERLEEERRLAELEAAEQRKANQRERERQEAAEREQRRRDEDRKSRDHLEEIAKEKENKEKWALEKLRLLRDHEELEKRRQALTSKETLERLTRKPYYSRENLSTIGQPEVTTKVERQVIERVDRTLWSSDDRYPSTTAATTHYSQGVLPPANYSQHDTHDDLLGPQRLYSANNTSQDDRASRLKARNEKARRDYFSADPSGVDQLSDRFSRLDYPRSDFDNAPPFSSEYARQSYTSPYDQEYKRLVQQTERNLAAYRQRLSQPSLNTGLLETDLLDYRPSTSTRPEDDVYRSKSVLDYTATRQSRRDIADSDVDPQHSRSKSADYLMSKQLRDSAAPPENELKKTADGLSYVPVTEPMVMTEHEQRFRKSMERLQSTAPEWYRDRAAPPTNLSQATDYRSSGYGSRPYSRQFDWSTPYQPERQRHSSGSALHRPPGDLGSPVGGIAFPVGMFDKYKNEIEDMRRSRSSLHQVDPLGSPTDSKFTSKEYSKEEYLKRDVRTFMGTDRLLPGYTVTTIPKIPSLKWKSVRLWNNFIIDVFYEWNLPRTRDSRVIEVADTFIGRTEPQTGNKYGGRVTIEEVLDAIFQETNPSAIPADPSFSVHSASPQPPHNTDGLGIYTPNHALMDRVIEQPHMAEYLLRNEPLIVRCAYSGKTQNISEARHSFVSCKHCYTYYASKEFRFRDWDRHKDRCSFARINTLCKEVIMKVRRDPETQFHMSKVARDGYRREGRGSVNIRLVSAYSAQEYLEKGWKALLQSEDPNQLLFYYPIQVLIDQRKEPSLIQLCRKYNPKDKFILSVSIIADIEQCPETPPPEPVSDHRYAFINKPLKSSLVHDRYVRK